MIDAMLIVRCMLVCVCVGIDAMLKVLLIGLRHKT